MACSADVNNLSRASFTSNYGIGRDIAIYRFQPGNIAGNQQFKVLEGMFLDTEEDKTSACVEVYFSRKYFCEIYPKNWGWSYFKL